MTMDSPERVSSKMLSKYVALEYCFILMLVYWMFSNENENENLVIV